MIDSSVNIKRFEQEPFRITLLLLFAIILLSKLTALLFICRLSLPLCQLANVAFVLSIIKKNLHMGSKNKDQPKARLCVLYPLTCRY